MHVHVYTMDHPNFYQTQMKNSLVYKVFNHTFNLNAILCCPFTGAGSVVITCNLFFVVVIVLCFVIRYFMSILVLQSS